MTKYSSSIEAGVPDSGCYMTKAQVAKMLEVTVRTVDSLMKRGLLVYLKIGRTVRFKRADVEEHLRSSCRIGGRATASFTHVPDSSRDRTIERCPAPALDEATAKAFTSSLIDNALYRIGSRA